ncbi:MAG: type IV secretion system protein [Pseudomonadota bacterium]|nr:type IV secretion system protein [Pseudomonadota bacterium]
MAPVLLPQALPEVFNAMQQAGLDMAYRLIPDGQSLLHALLFLMLVMTGIKAVLEEGDFGFLVAEILRLSIMWGVCSWLVSLSFYPMFVKDLSDTFTRIVLHLGSGERGVYAGISAFMHVADALYEHFYSSSRSVDSGLVEHLGSLPGWLATVVLDGLCLFAVLFSAVIYVVLYAMSQMMLTVGVVLGPVFIPWLLLPAMSFMFEGWLRFMIVAGLYKVVGYVVIALMAPVFHFMVNWSASVSPGAGLGGLSFGGDSMSAAFVLLLMSGLVGYFMLSIPNLAQGLVSGSALSQLNFAKKPLSALSGMTGRVGGDARAEGEGSPQPDAFSPDAGTIGSRPSSTDHPG